MKVQYGLPNFGKMESIWQLLDKIVSLGFGKLLTMKILLKLINLIVVMILNLIKKNKKCLWNF
jgi:hypothetical protein